MTAPSYPLEIGQLVKAAHSLRRVRMPAGTRSVEAQKVWVTSGPAVGGCLVALRTYYNGLLVRGDEETPPTLTNRTGIQVALVAASLRDRHTPVLLEHLTPVGPGPRAVADAVIAWEYAGLAADGEADRLEAVYELREIARHVVAARAGSLL